LRHGGQNLADRAAAPLGSTESAVIAASRPPGTSQARERVTHDGDCLVPIVWIDLGVTGDDQHEEVLAFKTQGGR
jgi:hypothetical protein